MVASLHFSQTNMVALVPTVRPQELTLTHTGIAQKACALCTVITGHQEEDMWCWH